MDGLNRHPFLLCLGPEAWQPIRGEILEENLLPQTLHGLCGPEAGKRLLRVMGSAIQANTVSPEALSAYKSSGKLITNLPWHQDL